MKPLFGSAVPALTTILSGDRIAALLTSLVAGGTASRRHAGTP
ncbi:MAG TPA: hypothetical protein VMT05_06700 [Terriglobales bacterium]|jgi:hypothetical protein|nr:hypothetical protein [Terriglobales bacterium]